MTLPPKKVLPVSRIPDSLWAPRKLTLPGILRNVYAAELTARGLFEIARTGIEKRGIFGGASSEETDEHLAHRFAASSARLEYCTLGPDGDFHRISDALLTTFSEGEIAVLDLPCGTGAASASLVSTLIELRRVGSLPRLPLRLNVTAGDFSPPARKIFESILSQLIEPAGNEGIGLEFRTTHWDATRSDSTAALIDDWFAHSHLSTEWIVLITNFSGTLHNKTVFDQFTPCLEHIAARLHNRTATLVWIEPAGSKKSQDLMKRLKAFAQEHLPWFFRPSSAPEGAAAAEFKLQHPLKENTFDTNVSIERFYRKE